MSRRICYLAHPYGGDPANLDRAEHWLGILVRIFPDVDFCAPWISWCRALPEAFKERGLAFDLEMVRRCDEFWMAGDCSASVGATTELLAAREAGLRVVTLERFAHINPEGLLNASQENIDYAAELIRADVAAQRLAGAEEVSDAHWPSADVRDGRG